MDQETDAPVTGAEEFDLHTAVENAFEKVTTPDEVETPPEEITDQGSEAEPKPAETQPLEAPARWSAEDKAKFAALPREAQEIVLERESNVDKTLTQKSQELAEKSKRYDSIEQILAPRRQGLAMQFGDEATALKTLFELSDFAGKDPGQFVKWFAQQHGIDLGQTEQVNHDPIVQQVQQQVQGLNQQFQTIQQQQVAQTISSFKAERDETGQPRYPHFETVQMDMAQALNSGDAKDLPSAYTLATLRNPEAREKLAPEMPHINDVQKEMENLVKSGLARSPKHAYEMAVWNNPATREKMLDERKKADEAKRLEDTKTAASKAEKAKGITVRSNKGQPAPTKNASWEDTLQETYDRVVGEN